MKSFTKKLKPVSYKQLQEKYTEDEIDALIESGGVTEVAPQYDNNTIMPGDMAPPTLVLTNCKHPKHNIYHQVPHEKNAAVTLYIDQGDWEKTTETTRSRSLKDSMSKKADKEEFV